MDKVSYSCSPQAHVGSYNLFYLTIKGCWLPWRRVAKPLIGSLTSAPHNVCVCVYDCHVSFLTNKEFTYRFIYKNNRLQRIYHPKQQTYQYTVRHHESTRWYHYYQLQSISPVSLRLCTRDTLFCFAIAHHHLAGASTPYKRWNKCTMEKVRGEAFLQKPRGKCINY